MKKKKGIMKESEVRNNTNTHAYMQAEVNVLFMHMNTKKGIKQFGERDIAATIKEFKQLYEGTIPGKTMVIPLNPDELTYAQRDKHQKP